MKFFISLYLFLVLISGFDTAAEAATFDCVINPSMTLQIGSPVSTTLAAVEVERGQAVAARQIIARLESAVQAADVVLAEAKVTNMSDIVSAEAKLDFAQKEIARGETLLQTASVPRQKVEELRTHLRVAQGELEIAKLNHHIAELDLARARVLLEQRIIRSPIDAVVVRRLLGPGEYVRQDAPIVELAAADPLNVEAYPPTSYVSAIKTGMIGVVRADAAPNRVFDATVTVVDRVFDAASGTFGVRLLLPNPDRTLPAGLRCRVTLDTGDGSNPSNADHTLR